MKNRKSSSNKGDCLQGLWPTLRGIERRKLLESKEEGFPKEKKIVKFRRSH